MTIIETTVKWVSEFASHFEYTLALTNHLKKEENYSSLRHVYTFSPYYKLVQFFHHLKSPYGDVVGSSN